MPKRGRKYSADDANLNITSMMDVFTIVLVFLLKSFAAEGNLLTQADNLQLPYSTSKKTIQEVALTVVVDNNEILVDETAVVRTEDVGTQDSLLVAAMVEVLEQKREEEKEHAMASGDEDEGPGKVIVQLDKLVSYDIMYKVMATCGFAGYTNISFAVMQKNAE